MRRTVWNAGGSSIRASRGPFISATLASCEHFEPDHMIGTMCYVRGLRPFARACKKSLFCLVCFSPSRYVRNLSAGRPHQRLSHAHLSTLAHSVIQRESRWCEQNDR